MKPISLIAAAALAASVSVHAAVDLANIVEVSAGHGHMCAVNNAGAVMCRGNNQRGQLGDNSTASRTLAAIVPGLGSGVASVSAGGSDLEHSHTCVLTTGGGVKCWGANEDGQLGNGTTTPSLVPVDVTGLSTGVLAISAGGRHTCAIVTGGGVKCWGANGSGELGDSSNTQRLTPVDVTGLTNVVSVAATYLHTCALTSGGAMLCWGANEDGQLGDGTEINRNAPVPVSSLSSGVASISTGRGLKDPHSGEMYGTSCAVTTAGGTKCWGENGSSQVGDGTPTDRFTPFDVSGLTSGSSGVSIGKPAMCTKTTDSPGLGFLITYHQYSHTCGLLVDGSVKCWGGNNYGQLGSPQGSCDNGMLSPTPFATYITSGATAIGSGAGYSCVLMATGQVRCWGAGYPFGTATTQQSTDAGLVPQKIEFPMQTAVVPVGQTTLGAYGGGSGNPVVFTNLSPGPCTLTGSTLSRATEGICTVTANQAGNASYEAAPQVTLNVFFGAPAAQTITFGAAPTIVVGGTGTVSAFASSSLPVSFSSNTPSICSVSGSTVTGIAAGTCTIAADQGGNNLYAPAPQTTQNITVTANAMTVADLSVTSNATAPFGTAKDIVYTLVVTNPAGGGATNTGLTFEYPSPVGTAFIWASPGCTNTTTTVTCAIGTMPANTTATRYVVVRPTTAASMMTAAHVSGSLPEPSYANNRAFHTANVTTSAAGVAIFRYRLYSDISKEHHFTTDLNEYNVLGATSAWVQEGTVGKVLDNPGQFNGVTATPYYRLYNTATAWHHWTTDANEYYTLATNGWNGEGVDGWILPTATAGATELFRLNYPPLAGLHHWTIDPVEYNALITTYGWVGEGGSGFVIQ